MSIGMYILIGLGIIFVIGMTVIVLLALSKRSPEDRRIDDEDQIKYLHELARKKSEKGEKK